MEQDIHEFITENIFESLFERNYIEDDLKMSEVPKPCQYDHLNNNSIYLDFETALFQNQYGGYQ